MQGPGERVFFHGHPSWRSMLLFYLKGIAGSIMLGVVAGVVSAAGSSKVKPDWVTLAVLVGFLIVVARGLIERARTTYTITDQRLTIGSGLLGREVRETRLERIQNVSSRQTLLERLLGVGTVDFDTAAGAGYDFSFRGVANPDQIVRTVDRALRDRGR